MNRRGKTTRSVKNLMTRTMTNLQKSGVASNKVRVSPPEDDGQELSCVLLSLVSSSLLLLVTASLSCEVRLEVSLSGVSSLFDMKRGLNLGA